MATTTTVTVTTTATGASTATSTARAPSLGIFQHGNPVVWSASDPIVLFIIQAGIIVIMSRLLHWPLQKLRQPRVIAEVLTGIVLGPSVMGRIPNFTALIFPTANNALAPLTLVANIGLVFFLFLVGLEADLRFLGNNWKTAATVGTLGMAFPFGCGAAIAWGLFKEFHTDAGLVPIAFGTYLLFIAIAMSITAFPVLCRILIELKLLQTPVGIVTLSAGIANDVVGWILLALCVAIVNASDGITALYVLLVAVGYIIVLCFAVRPAFLWFLKRNGSLSNGPSQGVVTLTMMMVLISAWFTDIIGIHPVFGAFLMGLIVPHDGGFAIRITEKIEDFVSGLFVPIFFTLSGLNTNLGLLNDGRTWAYVVAIIVIAFVTKISGGAVAARLTGRMWRESLAIGVLMSCKGLVELIVLNIGFNAHILSQRTFTMFVVMALVTTFATTPLVTWLYPPWYQQKLESWRRGEIDWEGNPLVDEKGDGGSTVSIIHGKKEVNRVAVYVRLDTLPGVLALVSLFARQNRADIAAKVHPSKRLAAEKFATSTARTQPFEVQGIGLKEIGDRESSLMKISKLDEQTQPDSALNTFRVALGQIVNVAVRSTMLQCLSESYSSELLDYVNDAQADMLLLPWSLDGTMSENQMKPESFPSQRFSDPFYNQFMSRMLDRVNNRHKTAVFIDNDFGRQKSPSLTLLTRKSTLSLHNTASRSAPCIPLQDHSHHIFLPFFGTQDGLTALNLALQLAQDPTITATIVHFHVEDEISTIGETSSNHNMRSIASTIFQKAQETLPAHLSERVVFESFTVLPGDSCISSALSRAHVEVGQNTTNAGDLVILGRDADTIDKDFEKAAVAKMLGTVAGAFIESLEGMHTSFLLVSAATNAGKSVA